MLQPHHHARRALALGAGAFAANQVAELGERAVRAGRRARAFVDEFATRRVRRRLEPALNRVAAARPPRATSAPPTMRKASVRPSRKRPSRSRKVRKRVLRVRRRGGRGRRSSSASRASLILKLAAPQVTTYQDVGSFKAPDNNSTLTTFGKQCTWYVPSAVAHTPGTGANVLNLSSLSLWSIPVLQDVMFQNGFANNFAQKYFVYRNVLKYRLVNMSNTPAYVTAYKLRVRHDLPSDTDYPINIVSMIADGYASMGIATSGLTANNTLQSADDVSIYSNLGFVEAFQIIGTTKMTLQPGIERGISLKAKSKLINPTRFQHRRTTFPTAPATTSAGLSISYMSGDVFYLFKLSGGIADSNVTPALVGFTHPKVDIFIQRDFHYKVMPYNAPTIVRYGPDGFINWGVTDPPLFENSRTNVPVNENDA